jgi:hypothetical protein
MSIKKNTNGWWTLEINNVEVATSSNVKELIGYLEAIVEARNDV